MRILTLTCWPDSIKFHLFDSEKKATVAKGKMERVSLEGTFLTLELPGKPPSTVEEECLGQREALELILKSLETHGFAPSSIAAVGHRVAHGGELFTHSVRIDPEVLAAIHAVKHLAPLHNGANLEGIEAALEFLPAIPHIAIFDTAFHQTLPPHAYIYPLPYEWYEKHGVRRYGFHGPSHLYLSRRGAALLGKEAQDCKVVTVHLDRGVSLCAVRNGISVDTSMGLTPLEGAVMRTRCGDIDPGIPPFIMQQEGFSPREMQTILNQRSGLHGIAGQWADRKEIQIRAGNHDARCQLALDVESYRLRKYLGAYMALLGGADAVVMSCGTGEDKWMIRETVLQAMEIFGIHLDPKRNREVSPTEEHLVSAEGSAVPVYVVPTDEERVFVEDVLATLHGTAFQYSFAQRDAVP